MDWITPKMSSQQPPTEAITQPADAGLLHRVVSLRIVPIDLKEANAFVRKYHRHHKATVGHKFSLAIADETDEIRGVAIVGRPVARMLDNGWTLEVNRCCTDGVRNGCSMLYGKAWQVAQLNSGDNDACSTFEDLGCLENSAGKSLDDIICQFAYSAMTAHVGADIDNAVERLKTTLEAELKSKREGNTI
jgi:hypothetical protein